jgi:hypothetical protein
LPVSTVNSMRISAPSSSVHSTWSGLRISTSPTVWISPAVTVPGPCLRTTMRFGPSPSMLMAISLMFRTMSVTSSRTPEIEENSCSTPSICTAVTAAPRSDDRRTRRSALPSVRPKPRSSGSATRVVSVLPLDENSSLLGLISSCQFFWIMLASFRYPATIQSWRVNGKPRRSAHRALARCAYVAARRGASCAGGSHCAGSASRRGSR